MEEVKLAKGIQLEDGQVLCEGMDNYDHRTELAKSLGWKVPEQSNTATKFEHIESMPIRKTLRENLAKALTTTLSVYAAGNLATLIPVYVDPEIIDLTRRATPLRELIPRVTNYGKTADYNQITTITTAQALAEDAALTEQNDTYVRRTLTMKYLYSIGRVTGPMFAASKQYLASGGYIDALSLEVKAKTLALVRLEEAMILLGDTNAAWTEPVNSTSIAAANSFDGLYRLIGATLGGSSSYVTDKAGASLTIADIRTGIRTARTAGGEPNLIVCDYATYDHIKSLIQDQLRYVSTTTIAWGITTLSFEGIPVIASRFLSTTAGSGSGVPQDARSMFILDTNVIEMRVLQDITYEELAKTNDSVKFMLKMYGALVCKAPAFNHIIIDIAA